MKYAAFVLLIATTGVVAADPVKTTDPAKPLVPSLDVRLSDGSKIKLSVIDESIPIQTLYGKLVIPRTDIRGIDFGPRLPEKVLQEIDAAITDLASPNSSTRDAAEAKLIKFGPSAFPAIVRASKSDNRSLVISAKQLRDKFAEKFPDEHLPMHDLDVIHTDDAKIAGRIQVQIIRVWTAQFGERSLNIADLVSVKTAPPPDDGKIHILPDPGNLAEYAGQLKKSFFFKVTGNHSGAIYGTGTYTTDSTLATAVVHAGVLKTGETGVVKVTIVEGLSFYQASSRNGVRSNSWNSFPTAFKVEKGPKE
jgi:hypothetical protein